MTCRAAPRRAEREVASSQSAAGQRSPSRRAPAGGWSPCLCAHAGGEGRGARGRGRERERERGSWLVGCPHGCECRADRGSGRTDRDASSRAGPTPPVTCSHIVPPYEYDAPAVGHPAAALMPFVYGWGWDHAYFAPRYIGPAIIVLNSRGSIFTSAPQAWSLGPLGFRTLIVVSFCFNK